MFDTRPGWYRGVEAVAVEPTPQEVDADPRGPRQTAMREAREKPWRDALALVREMSRLEPKKEGTLPDEARGPGAVSIAIHSRAPGSTASMDEGSVHASGDKAWYYHGGSYDDYRSTLIEVACPGTAARLRDVAAALAAAGPDRGTTIDGRVYSADVRGVPFLPPKDSEPGAVQSRSPEGPARPDAGASR